MRAGPTTPWRNRVSISFLLSLYKKRILCIIITFIREQQQFLSCYAMSLHNQRNLIQVMLDSKSSKTGGENNRNQCCQSKPTVHRSTGNRVQNKDQRCKSHSSYPLPPLPQRRKKTISHDSASSW